MTRRRPAAATARLLSAVFLSAVFVSAGLFALTPAPRAQGTLIAPGGASRVTAPGGLRGRARLHRHHRHRMHRRHR